MMISRVSAVECMWNVAKLDHLIYFIGEFGVKQISDFLLSFWPVFFFFNFQFYVPAHTDTKTTYIIYCVGCFSPVQAKV